MEAKLSEIQIIPVKPHNGLLAFVSFVINSSFFVGDAAIYSRLDGQGFRLAYSTKVLVNGLKINCFHLNTKNGEKREVPMNAIVQKAVIGVLKNPESQYVFCNKDGKPYANVRKSFFTACKKAGIISFRFHDLRHTFGSQLVMSGVDLNTVRELLGHKSLQMTLRYSHLSPDHKKRAVNVLGQRMDTIWTPEAISVESPKMS